MLRRATPWCKVLRTGWDESVLPLRETGERAGGAPVEVDKVVCLLRGRKRHLFAHGGCAQERRARHLAELFVVTSRAAIEALEILTECAVVVGLLFSESLKDTTR